MRFTICFKRVSVVLILTMFASGLCLFPGSKDNRPRVVKGAEVKTVSGTLVHWRHLEKTGFDGMRTRRRMKPVLNFGNPRKIVKPGTPNDPVVQTTYTGKGGSLERRALGMTAVRDFPGMNYTANGAGWPPDTCGDVGPTYYVQAVNTSIGIFDKRTGEFVSATTFDAFFPSSVGEPCDNNNNGDVIVLYDRYNQRWFLLDFTWFSSRTGGSYYSIAASKTGDPTGAWWTYCFQADNTLLDDYPKCGVWHDGIYITANMYQFSGGFQHVKVWALKIPELYNGILTTQSVTDNNRNAWALLPVNAKGPGAPPAAAPNYMYAVNADEYGGQSTDSLYVWKYTVDWNNSDGTTWTGPIEIAGVAPFGLISNQVPQQGTANTLDSLYGRLMYPANYINFGGHESVYLCHLVEYNGRRAMRWYEIRISGGNSSIFQQGTYSPDSHHRWMGSICGDKNGNIAMGYSVSSSSLYPAIRYCGRLSPDAPGTMAQGEATIVNGGGYQHTYDRWGDYSHLTLDPDDDETFWYTQEYYTSPGTDWQTRIAAFKVGGEPPPPAEDIDEALDNSSLNFTRSGSADWAKVADVYYYEGDSARSGAIENNQSCSIETTISPPSTKDVKFYWKVSSEFHYDYLVFYIDGILQDRVSGSVDWKQKTFRVSAGSHTLKWTYSKDYSVGSGSDCGWVDKVEISDPAPGGDVLAKAVDYETLTFTTTGPDDWFPQTAAYHYDGDAAQSPAVSHNENTSMQTSISGFTAVKFYWKVSSETNFDYLNFYIDGVLKGQISGNVDWQQRAYSVSPDSHTLKWTYAKDYCVSSGSDCGWVDNLELGSGGRCVDAVAVAVDDTSCQNYLNYSDQPWEETTGSSYCGISSLTAPAALSHNESTSVETAISGFTSLSFHWKVSSEENYDFLEFYIDGVRQERISGELDWHQKTYAISSGPHTLGWVYTKDYSMDNGSDTAWLDCIILQ